MSFASERIVKAVRRRQLCDGCNRHIEPGQPAIRWAGMVEGEFSHAIYHPDCREAETELNRQSGWCWGDDWFPLSEATAAEIDGLAARFPAVAFRLRGGGTGPCTYHPDRTSITNLDGDNLCQECADAWVKGEGDHQAYLDREAQAHREGEADHA